MLSRKLVVSLAVALCLATVEAWDVHTDDGCAVETHCNACLLKLGTAGELARPYAPPPVVEVALVDDPAPAPAPEGATPRDLPTRGPPLA
jgi:hypothetical protein